MTWLYSLGLGKQTYHHLVHPPTNAGTISVPPLIDSSYIPTGFRWKFGNDWGVPIPWSLSWLHMRQFYWFIYKRMIDGGPKDIRSESLETECCLIWKTIFAGVLKICGGTIILDYARGLEIQSPTSLEKRCLGVLTHGPGGSMWPRERQCWRPQTLRETGTAFSPRGSEGSTALLPRWFQPRKTVQTSSPQTVTA